MVNLYAKYVACVCALLCSTLFCACAEEPATLYMSSMYVRYEADCTYARFCEWRGEDECIVFPVLTDLHSESGSSRMRQIANTAATTDLFSYDLFANLGDTGIDLKGDLDEDVRVAQRTLKEMKRYTGSVSVICKGNHDTSRAGFTSQMFVDKLQAPLVEGVNGVTYYREHACGYVDLDAKRMRVYFLNSSDIEGYAYGYSLEQMLWFADTLSRIPDGYHVVVLTHYTYVPEYQWVGFEPDHAENNDMLYDIIHAFQQKLTCRKGGLLCNFSRVSPESLFVGIITGDRHFDYMGKYRSINVTSTQGYGGIKKEAVPESGRRTQFNSYDDLLVDVVAIKPAKREVRYFRLGAGGAACDRGYNYGPGYDFMEENSRTPSNVYDLDGRRVIRNNRLPITIHYRNGQGRIHVN